MVHEFNATQGACVLVVEDDQALRAAIESSLELAEIDCICVADGEQAIAALTSKQIRLVLSDVNMPKVDGLTLLHHVQQHHSHIPMMLMTAYSSIDRAVSALQRGAVDYLAKPFALQTLTEKIEQFAQPQNLSVTTTKPQPVIASPVSQQVFAMARKVASAAANVLITGESGTGKEVLARYIHEHSSRARGPFVAINCAAIPENMLESVLFGHEKGAYTGAHKAMPGKFELAHNGTLLLDEVTEMPTGLQAKILRVIQEREVERLGAKAPIIIDVRVISTSNRNLFEAIADKTFREDLYYRLNVLPIHWPALRERVEDIVPLAEYFIAQLSKQGSQPSPPPPLLACAVDKLMAHSWPGNVRELHNVMQRSLIFNTGTVLAGTNIVLNPGQAVAASSEAADSVQKLKSTSDDLRSKEFKAIVACVRQFAGNRAEAAQALGISGRTLRYKLAKIKKQWPEYQDI